MSSRFGVVSPLYHFMCETHGIQVTNQTLLDHHLGDVHQLMKSTFLQLTEFSWSFLSVPFYKVEVNYHHIFWQNLITLCLLSIDTFEKTDVSYHHWHLKFFLAIKLTYILFEDFSIILLQRICFPKGYQCILNCFIFLQQFKRLYFSFFHEGRSVITPCQSMICWQCTTNLCSQMLMQLIDVNISLIISAFLADF